MIPIPCFCLLVLGILVTLVVCISFWIFFRLAHLALQNINLEFLYFRNLFAKSDQKPKTKNGMNETKCRFPNIYQANINALVLERKRKIEIQALHFPEISVGFKFVLFKTKFFF